MQLSHPTLFQSPFSRQLAYLLGADILLSFLYGFTPTQFSVVRSGLALVQFGFMTWTMALTLRRIVEDY
ncbi:MAG TPA: hypothetical protein VLI05_04355 [Candidatus Saccharimonadia bacterium]|nr:hypothetical protein [Candidatus Saccharimonadia bacterium]